MAAPRPEELALTRATERGARNDMVRGCLLFGSKVFIGYRKELWLIVSLAWESKIGDHTLFITEFKVAVGYLCRVLELN